MTTPDHIEGLPARFSYLEGVLRKYTQPRSCREIEDARRTADRLDTAGMQELAIAYREIVRRDDMHAFSAWAEEDEDRFSKQWEEWLKLNEEREGRGERALPDAESPIRPRGLQLFYIFDSLAKKDLPPFATREVEYSPPPVKPDWSKLPAELRYLGRPATRYGQLQFHEQRKRFRREMTAEQRDELTALASRLRSSGDVTRLMEWWRQCADRGEDPTERDLTYWLMAVVNEVVPERPVEKKTANPSGLNWAKLPGRLDYLGFCAESYKEGNTPEARARLVRALRATRGEEYEYLKTVGETISEFDEKKITAWLKRYPPDVHPEAEGVTNFLTLLRELFRQ